MTEVLELDAGGYRYLSGLQDRSGGVAAAEGFAIRRVRLRRPLPLEDGFAAIHTLLRALDRPLSAFCACELRCPAPLSDQDLREFNLRYLGVLARWGLVRGGLCPVARSDVCPEFAPPGAPAIHAFCVTVPQPATGTGTFVTSGSNCALPATVLSEGDSPSSRRVSAAALRTKAEHVLAELEQRMKALGFSWLHATATQLYTVHDFHPFMGDVIERRGAAPGGLTWHLARPPLLGLDYQMDVRGITLETVL